MAKNLKEDGFSGGTGEISEGEREAFSISRLLESVPYPATREDIMDYASDQGVPEEVLDMLEGLPDTTFNNPADVSQAMGENSQGFDQ